ncbi:MAG: outer membrane protein transport protein [Planctomycetaceae bacterium]|jgi:long-chain fatty acid transport protein|nr:outer membrane protein transport protein [Planctomycetaceae bacterium]
MKKSIWRVLSFFVVVVLFFVFFRGLDVRAQGVMLRGIGAVNASVGGTATGMPLDSAGAINWNPASISALDKSELSFGLGLIFPHTRVSSQIANLSGSTKGEAGTIPNPTMSFVWHRCPKSALTFGLGVSAVGGAASLYPADTTPNINPILSGRAKSSQVVIFQLTPTASYQLTKQLSIGIAPVIDLASLSINPMQLGQSLAPGNELHNYGTRYAWGGGFQIGTFYDFKNHFKAGFMFKSPVWFENLRYEGTTVGAANNPSRQHSGSFDLDLPNIFSFGISYDGFKDTVVGVDVRYFDYSNAAGFNRGIINNGTNSYVGGLDWESILGVTVGLQKKWSDKLTLRAGYVWNENPIPSRSSMLNVAAPLTVQHTITVGATYAIVRNLEFSFAYAHGFKGKVTGNFNSAQLIGTVTNETSGDEIMMGITKKW